MAISLPDNPTEAQLKGPLGQALVQRILEDEGGFESGIDGVMIDELGGPNDDLVAKGKFYDEIMIGGRPKRRVYEYEITMRGKGVHRSYKAISGFDELDMAEYEEWYPGDTDDESEPFATRNEEREHYAQYAEMLDAQLENQVSFALMGDPLSYSGGTVSLPLTADLQYAEDDFEDDMGDEDDEYDEDEDEYDEDDEDE